jgi:HAD superfamily hydrolase (TIGR01484 family)
MIKAIILDVDGVIVGEKPGFNFPWPHAEVMERLKHIKKMGIPISLCTAKPYYAVQKIIDDARLDNIHITMAGGVMIDPIDGVVLEKHPLDPDKAKAVTATYVKNDAYTEIYTVDNYFIQANQACDLTAQHTEVLQKTPIVVTSLIEAIDKHEIVKVLPIARDEHDKTRLDALFAPYTSDLVLSWGVHPFAAPHKFGNITAQGISKRQATTRFAESLGIQSREILGVGDSLADWQFIELCGYAAAMGNASADLKELVATKGRQSCIGKSVDKNGILSIFDYFDL